MRSRLLPTRPPGFARIGRLGSVAGGLALASSLAVSLCTRPAAAADEDEDAKLAEDPDSSEAERGADDDSKTTREHAKKSAPSLDQKSRFQIAFYTTIYSYSKLSFSINNGAQIERGSITETSWAPSANPVTLELGYAFSDSLVLGLLLEFGSTNTTTHSYGYENAQTTGRFLVGPRAEYSFGDRVRPFIDAIVGFTTVPQSGDSYSVSLNGVEFAGGLGLRWFLTDRFSIDPCVRGTWGTGSGRVKTPLLPPGGVPATGNLLSGAALLGISGWI